MPPKRLGALRKVKPKVGTGGAEIAPGPGVASADVVITGDGQGFEAVAPRVVDAVRTKGFCVIDGSIDAKLLAGAEVEIKRLQDGGDFQPPPAEIVDGLLGEEGSRLICELSGLAEQLLATAGGAAGLLAADQHLAHVVDALRPFEANLGLRLHRRSRGLVHVADTSDTSPTTLTEAACQRWLTEFGRHRLMLLLLLGPFECTLKLAPFADEEANPVELRLQPGALVVLRADTLSHSVESALPTSALTCWAQQEVVNGQRHGARCDETMVLSPQYQALVEWKRRRLEELKDKQVVGAEGQEWDAAIPRDWQYAANRMFNSGPQVGLRSFSCKFPQTDDPDGFWRALANGMDFARPVPFLRWDHSVMYDPAPNSWRWSKTCCQHGCFADGLDFFDCRFFGISPFEAKGMDPNQRHILETSYEALERAGFSKKSLQRQLVGVYIGAAVSEFSLVPLGPESAGATSGANSITSNRISFCLGMQGPSYTLDNQGAASLSCVTAASLSLRMQTSRYKPNHTCLVGGTYIQLAGSPYVLATSQGWLSRQGRCLTFDASSDGYIKSDGVSNAVLSPASETVDGRVVIDESGPLLGIIAAASMSHTGRGASLTAPNGPQERELILEAVRQASIGPGDLDAVEAWGESAVLKDAVEVEALKSAVRGDLELMGVPLFVATGKTEFGNMCETAGMAALIRVMLGQRLGYAAPAAHLCQLSPHIEAFMREDCAVFVTEVLPYQAASSFHGVSGKSMGGTMVHVISFGTMASKLQESVALRALPPVELHMPLAWWPAGGGELPESAQPSSAHPYQLVGSWSEWSGAEPMRSEGAGVYVVDVTIGANRFEEFQILVDGDPDRVLHPEVPTAASGSAAVGPNAAEAARHLRWTIDGRSAAVGGAAAADGNALRPGSCVRVRLRVLGRWRAVDWTRVSDPGPGDALELDKGRYYAVGSFNDWSFRHELRPVGGSHFLYQSEVGPLPWAGGDFVIVRNQDWSQTFFPPRAGDLGETPEAVLGPDECPEHLAWSFGGLRGDRFVVEFRRMVDAAGIDERRISWKRAARTS